ncbi:hypothetical protein [Streptomyces sp. NEAU-S7GS2]|uniref:hypothetical protein n=1 Tax=Streptomyces sp. NEAU-S7GS2 TaxID=2202000 RepID=UPI000D6EFFF8|nr:hypothetical protein [Streptomyces sp. NEAU-S7GS2]AWN30668.1 hypothetical protein DKG71_35370 [Streptomyces sp. NEAU-S7GS2]
MTWQRIGLVLFSLTLLPAGQAMVTGYIQTGLRTMLAGASPAITVTATATAGAARAATGCVVAALVAHRTAAAS